MQFNRVNYNECKHFLHGQWCLDICMWQNSTWSWTTGCCSSFAFSQHFLWVLACSEAVSPPLSLLHFPLLTMWWGPVFLLFAWGFVAGFSFWCVNNLQQSELEVSDVNGIQSIIITFFPLNVFGIQDSIILLLTLITSDVIIIICHNRSATPS